MATEVLNRFDIQVVFNGVPKTVTVTADQQLQAVLQHALNEFDIRNDRDRMALFTPNNPNTELPLHQSVRDAGLTEETMLVLRPREVRGG